MSYTPQSHTKKSYNFIWVYLYECSIKNFHFSVFLTTSRSLATLWPRCSRWCCCLKCTMFPCPFCSFSFACVCARFFYVNVIINTLLMWHTYEQRCLFMNTNESQWYHKQANKQTERATAPPATATPGKKVHEEEEQENDDGEGEKKNTPTTLNNWNKYQMKVARKTETLKNQQRTITMRTHSHTHKHIPKRIHTSYKLLNCIQRKYVAFIWIHSSTQIRSSSNDASSNNLYDTCTHSAQADPCTHM